MLEGQTGRRLSASHLIVRPKSPANLQQMDQNSDGSGPKPKDALFVQDQLRSSASFTCLSAFYPSASYEFDQAFFVYNDNAQELRQKSSRLTPGVYGNRRARAKSECNLNLATDGSPWSMDDCLNSRQKHKSSEAAATLCDSPRMKKSKEDVGFEEITIRLPQPGACLDLSEPAELGGASVPRPRSNSCALLETATVSLASAADPSFSYSLDLQMKLKVSDQPVKCLAVARCKESWLFLRTFCKNEH